MTTSLIHMTSDRLKPDRRAVLLAGAALTFLPGSAFAVSTGTAERYVNEILGVVDQIINTRKSDAQMLREFEQMLAGYGDMPVIAR